MTQLEVPNISFTHYLDLLKRRTWHVVMVSVLGLLVGGTVALMVPRYYVAFTKVQLNRPVLDPDQGTPNDLMEQVVSAARDMVGRGVEPALERLKWPEAIGGTPESRRVFTTGVRQRYYVQDIGTKNRGRRQATVRIAYQDLDGKRAHDMANELTRIWLADFVDGLRAQADEELQSVNKRRDALLEERKQMAERISAFEKLHGLNPLDALPDERSGGVPSQLSQELGALEKAVGELNGAIAGLETQRELLKAQLEGLDPTIPVPAAERIPPALKAAYEQVNVQILALSAALDGINPPHPDHSAWKARLLALHKQKAELEQVAGDANATKPNPAYAAAKKALAEVEAALQPKVIERDAQKKALEAKLMRRQELAEIYPKYRELREGLRDIDQLKDQVLAEYAKKESKLRMISIDKPYQVLDWAYIPPRPTEPNPYLLALIGCVVGLGVAVGLIFLIDFLQMTYKSVSEVETALGVPVLGNMAYLETEREIIAVRDRRARLTLFAVLFLAMFLTVVTIYYIAPTNLPESVTEFFDFLLGK